MRVIGGEARGRQLIVPDIAGLRPTSDRVREAMFDILEARGLVEGATVLDLFAGSGALGIEALSRGAASCTFVDSDPRALAAVESNLVAVGLARGGTALVRADALSYLRTTDAPVEVGLLDPPYRFSEWEALLGSLDADVALLEHRSPLQSTAHFDTLRSYRYGGTLVTLVARHTTDKDLV